jgi:D-alanine-D-alanine ligase
MHNHLLPPAGATQVEAATAEWKTEYDVVTGLGEIGHEVQPLCVNDDLGVIGKAVEDLHPHIVFNLLDSFHNVSQFEQNVVSYLELLRVPYTGSNPRGLLLAKDKGLSKRLMAYHRIPMPEFLVVKQGQKVHLPKDLSFPLIVKSLTEEASLGISQASVVDDDAKLRERVTFIHEHIGTDALVERFIEGRELYVGVLGNERLQTLPVWELLFTNMPEDTHHIATERVKWSRKYQEKYGIKSDELTNIPDGACQQIQDLCKRVYRSLELSGYGRVDLRLDKEGKVYVLEANPNPQIAADEDFAESAKRAGLTYNSLLQRILSLGLHWRPERAA